jgi:excisionase family DNA binding protein
LNSTTPVPCPACREIGKDTDGDNLTVFPSGKFHCIAAGKDMAHNRRIIELRPELGNENALPSSGPYLAARPRTGPKHIDLLSRIKADYPATVADLWESSPVRCDDDLDDAKVFLQLLTDAGVAETINVSLRTVIDWRNAGKIPFIRIGRSIRYRPESIRALLEKLEIGGAS